MQIKSNKKEIYTLEIKVAPITPKSPATHVTTPKMKSMLKNT